MTNFSACYLPAEDEKDRKSWKDKRGYKKLSEKTAKGQNTEKTRKALGKGVVNLLMRSRAEMLQRRRASETRGGVTYGVEQVCTRAVGSQSDGAVPNGTPSSSLSATGKRYKGEREGEDVRGCALLPVHRHTTDVFSRGLRGGKKERTGEDGTRSDPMNPEGCIEGVKKGDAEQRTNTAERGRGGKRQVK
ncbi:hypothetical protein B0H13DRAFT_1894778 [Mycena leptocephala]|nr:hypothetical protein B0H13DRAFT_1894778 [Mycena leptocephala]